MLEVEAIVKDFGYTRALNEVSFVASGFKTIFGPNGAGKTTLIKILSTVMAPSSGTAFVNGVDLNKDPVGVRSQVGVVSHKSYFYNKLTALENLSFYAGLYEVDMEQVHTLLSKVGLSNRRFDLVEDFSRGMKQRLSIARALLHDPPVLLLDEPYTGLDLQASEMLRDTLSELDSKTVLMTTHNTERGLELCDSVSILKEGRVVFDKEVDEIDLNEFPDTYRSLVLNSATHR
ncbi:ABC-type multidrug transport system ATPase component [Methanonatronarchaeum thermophilum]|uniref:ABC-type multidrug transport system ATPase component n=1 Tax=Methanonatronarchaeum thermophilum TaxID=1927129 RepID=A0A1Y3GD33_9EURY|nr:ABC transporter ATP-binding protein [Methanonatronarchaeum thermophilum]OUJ19147.1 ABC-type multidrug transport system ATPase component [Methanonatronarchaeum thermophilum]